MLISTGTDRPYRILSFDGGGVHAVSYLPVLDHLETHLQQQIAQSGQFDMLVGTSTGAIVAMALKLGCPANAILGLYQEHARAIFRAPLHSKWLSFFFYKYRSSQLRAILAGFIHQCGCASREITWEELAKQSHSPNVELVVTLWDVRKEQRSFLSTNPDRPNQAAELWQAPVADIVTACCSAPYYFPARSFELPSGDTQVYCDGGITGLNNPSAFGVSLAAKELRETGRVADILSFGSGEFQVNHTVQDIRDRSVTKIGPMVINALMKSSSALMDRFYEVFGSSLPIRKYLRTNQPRCQELDDANCIAELARNFSAGNIHYRLCANENGKIVDFGRHTASPDGLASVWRDEFSLLPPAERAPISPPYQGGVGGGSPSPLGRGRGEGSGVVACVAQSVSDAPAEAATTPDAFTSDQSRQQVASTEVLPTLRRRWQLFKWPAFAASFFLGLCVALGIAFHAWRGEKQQRGIAEDQRTEAEKQRDRADELAKQERKQRERADGLLSVNRVSLADRELEVGNPGRATELLDECRWTDRGWEWRYLRRRASLRLALRMESATSVSFSPDGRTLASGSFDHTVKLWDAQTGMECLALHGHSRGVTSLSFSPDSRRLASGSFDETVKLWDTQSGTELVMLKGHKNSVNSVSFSPEGRRLASGSDDHTVKLWDAQSGMELLTLNGHNGVVHTVSFSPDGRRLASGSDDHTVKLWDAQSGMELLTLNGHNGVVHTVSFSPDGRRLASGSRDHTVKLWDAQSGMELLTLKEHTSSVWSVSFSPDGRCLASGMGDIFGNNPGGVKLWDIQTGMDLLTLKGHTEFVESVSFSPDGQRLASGSRDHTVKLWDAQTGREFLTLKGHTNWVWSVSFSPDGRRVASGSGDLLSTGPGEVKVWDAQSGAELVTLKGHRDRVTSVSFSPDGRRLASGSDDNTVKLWDLQSGRELLTLKGHSTRVWSVSFSPDGRRLASGSDDNTIRLWDVQTGTELLTLKAHRLSVTSVGFSPDGRRLASGSWDHTVKLWDVQTGAEFVTLKAHTSAVWSVRFSPDGRRLASGSLDKTVKLWDAQTGAELLTLRHTDSVFAVNFSPDGRRLASGGDKTIKLWDAQTGTELLPVKGHRHPVQSVGFSADAQRIVARDEKGVTKAWRVDTGQLVEPCTDTAPAEPVRQAKSPDRKLHVWINGDELLARRIDPEEVERQERGEAEIAITWHLRSAAEAEKDQQWFAAAFHLGQLIKLAKETKDSGLNVEDLRRRRAHALAELERSSRALEAPPSKKKPATQATPQQKTPSKE